VEKLVAVRAVVLVEVVVLAVEVGIVVKAGEG
jgi:hypothetical protein